MIAFQAEYPTVDPDFDLEETTALCVEDIAADAEELQMLRDLEELLS